MKPMIQSFDKFWGERIQALPPVFDSGFFLLTMIGDPIVTLLIGGSIIGRGLWTHQVRLTLAGAVIPATLFIGSITKELIRRVRPLNPHPGHKLWLDTYSFPSGHAAGSMIAYGLLAYFAWQLLPQPWSYIVAGLLALVPIGVGLSRVYLGVHFPSDVVAGWLLGLIALVIIVFVIRPLGGKA